MDRTPGKILFRCDWLKVFGVDAGRVAAQVVDLKSIRDITDKSLIGQPVRLDGPVVVINLYTELPVTICLK
jgi:pyrrolidone-carboxylate peptidase